MEAELFQRVQDALSQMIQGGKRNVELPLHYSSPIAKIVWSTFDYMAGPDLKFAWEARYSENVVDEAADGNTSSDSSLSKCAVDERFENHFAPLPHNTSHVQNTNECESLTARDQYEEIDAFYTVDEYRPHEDPFRSVQDEPLTVSFKSQSDSTSTARALQETSFFSDETEVTPKHAPPPTGTGMDATNCVASTSRSMQQQLEDGGRRSQLKSPMTTSCGVDSGIAATTSINSELSNYCCRVDDETTDERGLQPENTGVRYCVESGGVELKPSTSFSSVSAAAPPPCTAVSACEEVLGLAGGRRRHGDKLVADCSSSFASHSGAADDKASSVEEKFDKEAALLTQLMIGGSGVDEFSPHSLSIEEFVTKFVLAEQICSTQLSSNPLIHKLCSIPSRRITFASYLFSVKHPDDHDGSCRRRSSSSALMMAAFSLIFPNDKLEWYLEQQALFERIFADAVSRFKAAHMVETFDDLVYRATKDFTALLEMLGALEHWPLCNHRLSYAKIQFTHLWDRRPKGVEMLFLAKAVTACLMCRGQCAVVGSEKAEVMRMMLTLGLFLDEDQRLRSLSPRQKHPPPFNPYLCLQQVKRSELESQFYALAADAHWPVGLVDMDRRTVCCTGSYARHRSLKRSSQLYQLATIFRDAGIELPALDEARTRREPPLELQAVKADGEVLPLLENLFLMPLEKAARYAYIDHFHLRLENRAKALLTYAEEASRPNLADKRSALSSQWNLAAARKALGLQSESAFGMILARADSLQSGSADFLLATTGSSTSAAATTTTSHRITTRSFGEN